MMSSVLVHFESFNLSRIVVDDSGDAATQQQLDNLITEQPGVTLTRLVESIGKGAAVVRGLQAAANAGFNHVVQVDANDQHVIGDIPKSLALTEQHPVALIPGQSIYDGSIPRSRLYGHQVTYVWVRIETLSLQPKDSMCGFRAYLVVPALQLAKRAIVDKRTDFDTEAMVRPYRQGNTSYFVPTRVTHSQDRSPHSDALENNVRIPLMHMRLFLGVLPRIFSLLVRRSPSYWA